MLNFANLIDVLSKLLDVIGTYRPLFRSWNGSVPELNIMKPEHLQVLTHISTKLPKTNDLMITIL